MHPFPCMQTHMYVIWPYRVNMCPIFPPPTLQVLDDKNVRRRFRASNYQSTTRVKPFICTMPMRLDDGWNQVIGAGSLDRMCHESLKVSW